MKWRGERGHECARWILELEYHRLLVGGGHALDHREVRLARTLDVLRREDDALEGGQHVLGGQRRAVMKLDVLTDLERVGLAAVGGLGHLGAQIADEVGRRGRIVGVYADEHAVEGRDRMDEGKRRLAMAIEAG